MGSDEQHYWYVVGIVFSLAVKNSVRKCGKNTETSVHGIFPTFRKKTTEKLHDIFGVLPKRTLRQTGEDGEACAGARDKERMDDPFSTFTCAFFRSFC